MTPPPGYGELDGLWVGSALSSKGDEGALLWTLAVAPEKISPSIYGANLHWEEEGKDSLTILQGSWQLDSLSFSVSEKRTSEPEDSKEKGEKAKPLRHFNGRFLRSTSEAGNVWTLMGDWFSLDGGGKKEGGSFVLALDKSESVLVSAVALGQAIPDESLKDFLLPTNQIHWVLSILSQKALEKTPLSSSSSSSSTSSSPSSSSPSSSSPSSSSPSSSSLSSSSSPLYPSNKIFGCGFFDDSADVPDNRILFFTLSGTYNPETKEAQIQKTYQSFSQTQGITVEYNVSLFPPTPSIPLGGFEGKWTNSSSGGFGPCSACFQAPVSRQLGSILVVCEGCGEKVSPGLIHWHKRGEKEEGSEKEQCVNTHILCGSCLVRAQESNDKEYFPVCYTSNTLADGKSCADLVLNSFEIFSHRAFFTVLSSSSSPFHPSSHPFYFHNVATASLPSSPSPSPLPHLHSVSYKTIGKWVKEISCALLHHIPSLPRSHSFVSFPSTPTSAVIQLSLAVSGGIVVPVPPAADSVSSSCILGSLQPLVCFLSPGAEGMCQALQKMFGQVGDDRNNSNSLALVVVQDVSMERQQQFDPPLIKLPANVKIIRLSQLIEVGRSHLKEESSLPSLPPLLSSTDTTCCLFTSGSTSANQGSTKSIPFSESLSFPTEGACSLLPFIQLDFSPYDPTYLLSLFQTCQGGGERGYIVELNSLFSGAIQAIRPTHIAASPVFWNALYRLYLSLLSSPSCSLQKEENRKGTLETIARQARSVLGNRLTVCSSGGAALGETVRHFLTKTLNLDFSELYGSRETGGVAKNGVIYPAVDIVLLPLPDFGYQGSPESGELESGLVYKGEVCVCSPRLVGGYGGGISSDSFLNLRGKTYYKTGDVGEVWRERDRRMIRLIDRVGSFLKLSDGKWISPTKIENVLEQSPFVDFAFLMVSAEHPYPICAVVPSELALKGEEDAEEEELVQFLGKELRRWCVQHALSPQETPVRYHVDREGWGPHNGLLTSTQKKKRHCLARRFEKTKESLFSSSPSSPSSSSSPSSNVQNSFNPAILSILSLILPSANLTNLNYSTYFSDLGGDSLSAAHFSSRLQENNVRVGVVDIFKFPLIHFSDLIPSEKKNTHLDLSSIYGVIGESGPPLVDWEREIELPAELVEELDEIYKHTQLDGNSTVTMDEIRRRPKMGNLCLVGATGFLGPQLLHSLLSLPYFPENPTAKLICLARGENSQEVKERVLSGVKKAQLWEGVSSFLSRLEFLPFSLTSLTLGLSSEDYSSLVRSLERGHVILNAAWVNMVVPYEGLKKSNVGGTLNVLRLASRAQGRFHFISSVAAVSSYSVEEKWFSLSHSELNAKDGYGQTKAVCERLLYEVMIRYPADCRIYRPSYICGSRKTGYGNTDFTAHLLKSCVAIKEAPILEARTKKLHWAPVDFVAEAISCLALSNDPSLSFSSLSQASPEGEGMGRGGVFHFSLDGPYLGLVLSCLRCIYPQIQDVATDKWRVTIRQLEKKGEGEESGEKKGGLLRPVEVRMLQMYEWGDPKGMFSKGVDTRRTKQILLSLFGMSFPDRVGEGDLNCLLRYYRDSGFFGTEINHK